MATKKYKIVYDRSTCIGAASCVGALPETWSLNDDGKADLADFQTEDGNITQFKIVELDEEGLQKEKHAAEVCPVNIIHIFDVETGDQIC
jgi:ferredoxin